MSELLWDVLQQALEPKHRHLLSILERAFPPEVVALARMMDALHRDDKVQFIRAMALVDLSEAVIFGVEMPPELDEVDEEILDRIWDERHRANRARWHNHPLDPSHKP